MKKIIQKKRFRKFDFTLFLFAILIIFGTAVGVYALASTGLASKINPPNTCTPFQTPYLKSSELINSGNQVCVVSSNFFGVTCVNYNSYQSSKTTCGK